MGERLEEVKNGPRSVSQYNQYKRCPYSFYLERVAKVWQRPAAWLVQGIAFHEAIERFEREHPGIGPEDVLQTYADAYERHANGLLGETPDMQTWSRSGPYDGEADLARRYKLGWDQVADYLDWRAEHRIDFWHTPEGTTGIELGFDVDMSGVRVRGFIDQVTTELVRDLKTGNQPGDTFQLATYAVALHLLYGVNYGVGDYWMGYKNKRRGPTHPYGLETGKTEVESEFRWLDEQIKAEQFEPDPEPSKCRFCSVNASCEFREG